MFLGSLEGFVADGIQAGDSVVVIATPPHLASLTTRLLARNIDIEAAAKDDQYLALDAEETLSKFMVMGWPDEDFFKTLVTGILQRAKGENRCVRAFGEMVALLGRAGIPALPYSSNIYGTDCARSSRSPCFARIQKLVLLGTRPLPSKKFAMLTPA